MAIGKILNFPPLFIMYFIRVVNLIFHVELLYYAIKLILFYKWLFFFCP